MQNALLMAFAGFASVGMALSQTDPLVRPWEGEKKLIVVTTPDWDSVQGTLTRYEKQVTGDRGPGTGKSKATSTDRAWKQVGEPIPVVVGRNGLAWDPGLSRGHSDLYPEPVKHEGDGRSPAGAFPLNRGVFGFATSLPGSRLYMPLTPTAECVDDPASRHYAQIVDRAQVDRVDWNSSEKMSSVPGYRWGVVVNYNMDLDRRVRGDGSCIFLHQWSGPASGTAGCTAMAADDIEAVVRWVDGKDRAVLVQLPKSEYERLREHWNLP
jgi:D-alanyl-D-alanine dipeptidase